MIFDKKAQGKKESLKEASIAQGAIEYLLIIGAAILIVAVVVIAITSITQNVPSSSKSEVQIVNDPLLMKTYEARGFTALRVSGEDFSFFVKYLGENISKENLESKLENLEIVSVPDGGNIDTNSILELRAIDSEKIVAVFKNDFVVDTSADQSVVLQDYNLIYTCQDFNNINKKLNGKYLLMDDVTITKNCDGVTVLDTMVIPGTFSGELDGLGHTLNYQMQITTPIPTTADIYYGLISRTAKAAKIKNLNIQADVNNKLNYAYPRAPPSTSFWYVRTGGFIGLNDGLIENIKFTGNVGGHTVVGGIVGTTSGSPANSIIKNVEMNGNVSTYSGSTVGGIVGQSNSGIIQDSVNNAIITSKTGTVGGIVANNYNKIENVTNNGNIILGTTSDVGGGIVGTNYSSNFGKSIINNAINNGNVSGRNYLGGIAGSMNHYYNYDFNLSIENSINNGTITGTTFVGGITGRVYYYGAGINKRIIELKNNINKGSIVGTNKSYLVSNISKADTNYDPKDAMKYLIVNGNTNTNSSTSTCISYLQPTMDSNFYININLTDCSLK